MEESSSTSEDQSYLGIGVGLRSENYTEILEQWPLVDWFEATTENYLDTGGRPIHVLEKIRERYPVALHGVSMSIGSTDPLDQDYLQKLKELIQRIQPIMVSDHLCWTGVDGHNLHDLLPLPQNEETVTYVANRIRQVQEILERKIFIENVSSYMTYKHSSLSEWEFLSAVAQKADCGILLDINNIYVSAFNHKFDPTEYIQHIPRERIGYFHMAGHENKGTYLFDTHEGPIIEPVWDLYRHAVERFGTVSTLIEWDKNTPKFSALLQECDRAKKICEEVCGKTKRAVA